MAGEDSEEGIFEPEGDEEEGEREEGEEEAEAAERDWKAGLLNMLTPSHRHTGASTLRTRESS